VIANSWTELLQFISRNSSMLEKPNCSKSCNSLPVFTWSSCLFVCCFFFLWHL
jgi:hypothetical protein